jgi:hypothetical protein
LAGIFWLEYFGGNILVGMFWREYFGGNILAGKILAGVIWQVNCLNQSNRFSIADRDRFCGAKNFTKSRYKNLLQNFHIIKLLIS